MVSPGAFPGHLSQSFAQEALERAGLNVQEALHWLSLRQGCDQEADRLKLSLERIQSWLVDAGAVLCWTAREALR